MKNRCSNAVGATLCGRPLTKGFPNSGAPAYRTGRHRGAPPHRLSFLRKQESRSYSLALKNSKGISVLFLVIAMMLMVSIGYVFSYLIPTKQKSVLFPIQSNQAFFIAQSGVEFAVRHAKDQGWSTTTLLNNLNGITRILGSGRFTISYIPATDTLTSIGEVPSGTEKRRVVVSNFTSFLAYFTYRKSITVQSGQVSSGPHTNFPMLVSRTDPDLRTTANGGKVASYDAGTNDPRDIIFRALDDTTCGGSGTAPCTLAHEIETYVASTGQLVAWVRLPSINNGTVIYMYYGNSCMPSSTQNASGVWDANYRGVWHLSQNPAGTAPQMRDSTSNAYHGTAFGSFVAGDQQAAVIDGGLNFDSINNDEIRIAAAALGATSVTVSAWIRVKSFTETTFSPTSGTNLGAVFFNTRNVDGDVSPTLVVSPVAGGSGNSNRGLVFCNDSANVAMGAKGASTISLNTWYYAVGTFSRSGTGNFAGSWNVYLDGAPTGATNNFNLAGTATGNFTGATWRLANNAQWPNFSNVILDEVRVSNTVRSAGWIRTEYNNQYAPASFYSVGLEEN